MAGPEFTAGLGDHEYLHKTEASSEKPLTGAVYVCIGATRPEGSIGGPTSIALAKNGADVFITGSYPPKPKRVEKVLSAVSDAGSTNSDSGAFDITTDEGRYALMTVVEEKYGRVDGVLYYPAGGLMGSDEKVRWENAEALNISAPRALAQGFLGEKLIKERGFFQMMPSAYSWNPKLDLPHPKYDAVAATKHEGELLMHTMTPEFTAAGVSLVYVVGDAVDGTLAVKVMGGQHEGLPTIDDVAQRTVNIAKQARQGELSGVHVAYVGIADNEQVPLEIAKMDENEVARRLVYGKEALLIDSIAIYGNGRRGIANVFTEGERVRPILAGELTTDGKYTVRKEDVKGHFDEKSELPTVTPGIKILAAARQSLHVLTKRYGVRLSRISDVAFKRPVGEGAELEIDVVQAEISSENKHHYMVEVKSNDILVATLGLDYSEKAPRHNPETDIDPEYPTESAAQAALLIMQEHRGLSDMDDVLPLFTSIQTIEMNQQIQKGEAVTIDVSYEQVQDGFAGTARVLKADGTVAQVITGMSGIVKERARMVKFINRIMIR